MHSDIANVGFSLFIHVASINNRVTWSLDLLESE